MTPTLQEHYRQGARRQRESLRANKSVVVLTPRLMSAPKYAPRVSSFLESLESPTVHREFASAIENEDLERANVEVLRVDPSARCASGVPIGLASARRVQGLLRRGRVLSRDAAFLSQAVQALRAGANRVCLGTPESLSEGTATCVVSPGGLA